MEAVRGKGKDEILRSPDAQIYAYWVKSANMGVLLNFCFVLWCLHTASFIVPVKYSSRRRPGSLFQGGAACKDCLFDRNAVMLSNDASKQLKTPSHCTSWRAGSMRRRNVPASLYSKSTGRAEIRTLESFPREFRVPPHVSPSISTVKSKGGISTYLLARRFIEILPPDAGIEVEGEPGGEILEEDSSISPFEKAGIAKDELARTASVQRKQKLSPSPSYPHPPELQAGDELNGGEGDTDENAVEENVPFSEPERFPRIFVAVADIVDRELRDAAWDAHMQWMRRACLDPDSRFDVSWALTGLDAACLEPRYQVLLLRSNASYPVSAALGFSMREDDKISRTCCASEPLVATGGVGPWTLFEASVDDELNVSMPVRAPHVFLGLFNTSCRDYNNSSQSKDEDIKTHKIMSLTSTDRFGDDFVSGLTPRALAAEAARRAAESPLRRRLRLQQEFHHTMSPHLPPPDVGDDDPRDPYDLSSPLTEDAEGDGSPGGGYFEERASRVAQAEAVGGVVSLFATLYDLQDENLTDSSNSTTRCHTEMSEAQGNLPHGQFRSRLPIGTFLILNAASLVEARKYMGLDPLSGDMFSQTPRLFPANLQDTDGRHHLMGDTYYAQQELEVFHFRDPEDLLELVATDSMRESAEESGWAARTVANWTLSSGHDRLNAELLQKLEAQGISYRYERLPPPEDLMLQDMDASPEERSQLVREADANFAAGERALRAEMRRVRARRAADWPRLFDRDRDALPPLPLGKVNTSDDNSDNDSSVNSS